MNGGLRQKHLLWIIPLGIAAVALTALLALPKFVSSGYHRGAIEALASSLTGRTVHIRGKLSLALLPHPEFIAGDITITSPDKETITARSLTLDLAPLALLRGQVLARSITLQSPHIALPWPLPGGATAIAPPRWLTALHASINDGVVSLGGITFTQVFADIFTGGDGAFSVAGTGSLNGVPLTLNLGLGAPSALGGTPVTLNVQSDDATKLRAHVSGTYDSLSNFAGSVTFSALLASLDSIGAEPVTGSARITAGADQVSLSGGYFQQGDASISGSATLALGHPLLTLLLSSQNLVLPLNFRLLGAADPAFGGIPTHLAFDAGNLQFAAANGLASIPHLHSTIDFSAAGAAITSLDIRLPGNASLDISGTLDPAGHVMANAVFHTLNLPGLFSADGQAPALPPGWQQASLAASLHGTLDQLTFDDLAGNLGPARVSGAAVLIRQRNLSGTLHFDQLDLTPFAALLRDPPDGFPGGHALSGDFEITADRAGIGEIPLQHLLIDAALGDQFILRRLTASLWGGIVAASFTIAPNPSPNGAPFGRIGSARAVLALPSAEPLAVLLPADWRPPPAFSRTPLALSFAAAGPADALATSASLTLGAVSITAAPTIDLLNQTAQGAFTLRHPDAIAAFQAFGMKAGLAWPGAGSIALRAELVISPKQTGLPDFDLSMGDLTANGRLVLTSDHQLDGQIKADTLALPPVPANFTLPWADLAGLNGKITLAANRVLWAGNQILGPAAATLGLRQNRLELAVPQASLADGVFKGDFSATAGGAVVPGKAAPPAFTGTFSVAGTDSAMLDLPLGFPIRLPGGGIDAAADLTASGYAPQAWLATLTGSASLEAHAGTLDGFDLQAAAAALAPKNQRSTRPLSSLERLSRLRSACLAGTTAFTQLNMTGGFSDGIYTLTSATLQSPAGSAAATGSIDLPDTGIALNIVLLPNVPAPPALRLTIAGTWTAPRKITRLKQALAWKSPAPK